MITQFIKYESLKENNKKKKLENGSLPGDCDSRTSINNVKLRLVDRKLF